MYCNFQATSNEDTIWCPVCGRSAPRANNHFVIRRNCHREITSGVSRDKLTPPCPPGCQLSRVLQSIGQTYTPDCGCKSEAARMDAGTTTTEETLAVMRAEAEKRGLPFIESQARWLIELAYKLAEDQREPTRLERIRLKAMRLAVRVMN